MTERFTVLISSAGRRVSLLRAFRDALSTLVGESGRVIATDASNLSAAAWDADEHFIAPRCTDSAFIPFMLDLCQAEGVKLLIPTIDTELPMFAAHREEFLAIGTRVVISGPRVIEIAGDKKLTNGFLRDNNLPAVRQTEPGHLASDIETWSFPLIAKPRRGSASIGIRAIHDVGEIEDLSPDYVVEEFALGHEYTMDVYLDLDRRVRAIVPRLRLETRSGEVSKGVTVRIPQIHTAVERAIEALPDADGVLTVQAFFDEVTKVVNIIEINPRFGGGFPLSHAAGADFPLWMVQESLGLTIDADNESWIEGLTMLRFDDAVFVPAGL